MAATHETNAVVPQGVLEAGPEAARPIPTYVLRKEARVVAEALPGPHALLDEAGLAAIATA